MLNFANAYIYVGDVGIGNCIHPTETAPVIVKSSEEDGMLAERAGSISNKSGRPSPKEGRNSLTLSNMAWGFKAFDEGNLLINARAESLLLKPAFRELAKENRCVIPATSFYEWDQTKDKVTLSQKA